MKLSLMADRKCAQAFFSIQTLFHRYKNLIAPLLANMNFTFDQFRMMRAHHLIFGYRGTLTNELITSILQLSDTKLKELKAPFKKKKAIINILIECLQNILYHSEVSQDPVFQGHQCIFLLGKADDRFFIQIGNYIQNKVKSELKSKLDYMNTLQQDEIHNLYLEVLDKGQISEKGGAGLGILRILKDSGQQVAFEFFPVDESKSFFCMEINVLS